MDDQPTVTFIGLGAMGLPMATRLRSAGARLTLFDVSRAALERARSLGDAAPSIQDAIMSSEVVFTMLPADPQVLDVGREIMRHGRSGQIFVELSTIYPGTLPALQADAPPGLEVLSGSCMKAVAAAVAGDLTLFVGGSPDALERVRPLLDTMASRVLDVGGLAAPKTLKIINNMIVAGLNLSIAEAMVIAARAGVGAQEFVAALAADDIGGWPLRNQVLKHSVARDFPTGLFGVRYMAKDVALASRLCDDYSTARFLCGPVAATFRGAMAIGRGDHYHPVILEYLDHGSRSAPPGAAERPAPRLDDVFPVLKASTRAMEQLTCVHGLALARATGIPVPNAARHLGVASAASSTMAAFADGSLTGLAPVVAGAAEPVARALELAADHNVPAFALEAAHDFIRSGGIRD